MGRGITRRLPAIPEGVNIDEEKDKAFAALTVQLRVFVDEILSDPKMNVREAYKRAGYTASSDAVASAASSKLLAKPHVMRALALALAQRSQRTGISAERILKALWKNHRTAIKGVPIVNKFTGEILGHRPDLRSSNEALALCGKHVGMFTERVDVTSKGEKLEGPREVQVMVVNGQEVKF